MIPASVSVKAKWAMPPKKNQQNKKPTTQELRLSITGGEFLSVRAIRETRFDVGSSLKDHAYDNAGFAVELVVEMPKPDAPLPKEAVTLRSVQNNSMCN